VRNGGGDEAIGLASELGGRTHYVRTLVTGGAGFIGSRLVSRLAAGGDDVVVLDTLEEQVHRGSKPELGEGVRLIVGDVGDPEAARSALDGVDRVVHLAAAVGVGQSMYEIERYTRTNTLATAAFLEVLSTLPERPTRLVVASSMSIYGEGEYRCLEHGLVAPGPRPESQLASRIWECLCPTCGLPLEPVPTRETKPLIPTSVYAVNKRDQEELCLIVGAAYGIPSVALRFFNVYGPGQALSNPYTGVAAIFASRLLNGNRPVVFEDGRQTRDFIHVDDIVEGIVLALDSESAPGHAINLSTGRPSSVSDVAAALGAGLGVDLEPELPGQYRAGDIRHCIGDATRAADLLGFRPSIALEDGMAKLVQWLAEQPSEDHVEAATLELVTRGLAR
jgi:dTDP-L-rhamnose 4-epimerase